MFCSPLPCLPTLSPAERRLHETRDLCCNLVLVFGVLMMASLFPTEASAAGFSASVTATFQTIVTFMTGFTGKAVAVTGLFAMGGMALFGKMSYDRAMVGTIGIGLIFGAASVVTSLGAVSSSSTISGTDGVSKSLNVLINTATGDAGVALATISVIGLGIGALYGKITYQSALVVTIGIALVFGAVSLMTTLGATGVPVTPITGGAATPLDAGFGYVIKQLTGPVGRAVAVIGLMALGLTAYFGKISYPTAMVIAVGITLVWGSVQIVKDIAANVGATAPGVPGGGGIGAVLTHVANDMITGNTGKALGCIAVATLGIGAFFGKISYPIAIIFIVGMGLIFGAADIVSSMSVPTAPTSSLLGHDAVTDSLSKMTDFMLSNVAKALATIAVITIGIGALFGKVSYPAALITVTGICVFFGAFTIASALYSGTSTITAGSDCFGSVLGNFSNLLTGAAAKAIATIGVMILGAGAMFGKISYANAIIVVTGIGIVFGVNTLVSTLGTTPIGGGGTGSALADIVCSVVGMLTGTGGKAIATIAITMLGIGAMLGKVSYHLAITIIVGIACMFGANSLLGKLLGSTFTGCGSGASTLPHAC